MQQSIFFNDGFVEKLRKAEEKKTRNPEEGVQ